MADHNNPQSRTEEILIATIDGEEYDKLPQSRLEELLLELKEVIEAGGGGGGTTNYNLLSNLPKINNITVKGEMTASDLSLVLAEVGKGLSTNDYTNTDKAIVDGVTAALTGKQDALTAGLYIELDGNEISVKRDITQTAQQIEYNFTIPSDFTLRVKKYVNSDLVDTTDYTWNSVVDLINLDSIMEVSKKAGNYWSVKNLIASTTQAADYSVDLYAMQQAINYTQDFVATIDADKKLIIQSELDAALSYKVDKVNGKGLSANDFTDEYKAAIGSNTTAITAIKDGSELDSFGDVEVALLDKADTSDLGTAAAKDSTNSVTAGSTDLVESGAVKDAIDAAVAAAYHHAGTKTVAQLTHDLLIAANEGNVYNITDSGTTTSDFIEGIGKQIDAGDNVGICKVGNVYMFDLLSGLEDTSLFVQKSQTSGLLKNDGTVNTTIEDTVAGHTTAINGKQDKYDTITYAQWQAMTPEQQAAKDYYISDYPSSVLTAGNIAYDNTTSGMTANKVQGAIDELKSGLMVYPVEAQKNNNYVSDNHVVIIKIGHMVNISGRFQVSTEKPSGQENYLFTVPKPIGIIIPVYNAGPDGFIINQNGYLTANGVITTGYYNVNVTYSTIE